MNFLFLALVFCLSAQAAPGLIEAPQLPLSSLQNPAGIEWKKIPTEHFDVIFPDGLQTEARDVAAVLEVVYAPVAAGHKVQPERLKVILQAHTLNSNGFVTLAPRRSEWFVTPWLGPDVGQTEWLKTLAVHEFRHVVQFDKSREGFAKALRFILGETGTALAIGWTLPAWYLEGDAVGTETALTLSGRGRQPFFEHGLRTILTNDQSFSYEQMALGSYVRWRPNHYVIGYFLTTYLRRQYGADVLERIHRQTMERAYNPLAFYNAVERETGKSFDHIYKETLRDLTRRWKAQLARLPQPSHAAVATPEPQDWVNYSFPAKVGTDVVAVRESLGHIKQYVRVHAGQSDVLWTPSPLLQDFPFKVRQGLVATSEVELHPRWGMQDFSRVRIHDVRSGKVTFELSGTRALLPVLSHDASKLAYVEWSPTGDSRLEAMSVKELQKLFSLPWSRQEPILGMDWIPGKESVVVLYRTGTYELTLAIVDLKSGQRQKLAATSQWNWAYPAADENFVYFQSPASGIDNIHRISLRDGHEEQLTEEQWGAYHPSVEDGVLTYARYTLQGQRPVQLTLPARASAPTAPSSHLPYYDKLASQEAQGDVLARVKPQELSVEDYALTRAAINPHSWMLLAPPFAPFVIAQVRSTDVLNNFDWVTGAQWSLNERALQGFSTLRWSYFWPIVDFGVAFGSRRESLSGPSGDTEDQWEEGSSQLGVSLPYVSLHGAWTQNASVRGFGQILHAHGHRRPDRGDLSSNTLAGGGVEAQWSFTHRQAVRDLLPPWGLVTQGLWRSTSDTQRSSWESYQRYGSAQAYVPGLLAHHSLYGELAVENQQESGYHFLSPVRFSRGHGTKFMEQQQKASVNYAFPLLYPEWAMGRYFYLKRVALNLFHDNLWGRRYGDLRRFESAGAELWFDSNFVRNMFGFQWGLRWSSPLVPNREDNWELFLNTGVARW